MTMSKKYIPPKDLIEELGLIDDFERAPREQYCINMLCKILDELDECSGDYKKLSKRSKYWRFTARQKYQKEFPVLIEISNDRGFPDFFGKKPTISFEKIKEWIFLFKEKTGNYPNCYSSKIFMSKKDEEAYNNLTWAKLNNWMSNGYNGVEQKISLATFLKTEFNYIGKYNNKKYIPSIDEIIDAWIKKAQHLGQGKFPKIEKDSLNINGTEFRLMALDKILQRKGLSLSKIIDDNIDREFLITHGKKFLSYEEAKKIINNAKILKKEDYSRKYKEYIGLPAEPHVQYVDEWKENGSWEGFLGTSRHSRFLELHFKNLEDYNKFVLLNKRSPSKRSSSAEEKRLGLWASNLSKGNIDKYPELKEKAEKLGLYRFI